MRVVLDTNVVVSGLLSPEGPPGRIVDLFLDGSVTLLTDDRIVLEYREVLLRPRFGFERAAVEAVLSLIDLVGETVTAHPISLRLQDTDDQPLLEVAVAGAADALVTGNPRHFRGASAAGVPVLTPARFIDQWPR